MLRFALDNLRFPLGAIAAEAFPDVYAVAVENRRQPSFFISFFNFYDWDKGKELRSTFVDAFLRSNWAPGDLAIAANNAGILRKVFKRLRRKSNGDNYIKLMSEDLARRNDPASTVVKDNLNALIVNPDFYEEWD
jgi:hypothetical protein